MNFNIQTLMALISSVCLAVSTIRFPLIGMLVMIATPVVILVIALTSPQRGTQLDPSGRPLFKVLSQIWFFSLVQITLLVLLASTTYTGRRLISTLHAGSTYAYISFPMSLEEYDKIRNVSKVELLDSSGKVGDVTSSKFYDKNPFGNNQSYVWLVVVTQRWYIPYERSARNKAEVKSNGVIFISQ